MSGITVARTASKRPLSWRSIALVAISLAVAAAVLLGIWWVSRHSLAAEVAEHRLTADQLVTLDDQTAVAVRPSAAGGVEAFLFDEDPIRGWDAGKGTTSGGESGDGVAIGMMGWSGDTGLNWSSLLYGIGPVGTAHVEVITVGAVGRVTDPGTGAFFIVSREELTPDQMRYRLLDADGEVLFEGQGLAPARAS